MRFFIKVIIIAVVFVVALDYAKNNQNGPLVKLKDESGAFSVSIREPEKGQLKGIVRKIEDLVYNEATVHNPPGDMLPDQIDDKVINEVKEKVN